MRWWAIPLGAILAWFLFTLTPIWALHDLARAVQARDAGYVERHVNLRLLRLSMARQLADALRTQPGGDSDDRRVAADALAALAMPIAEALVTPAMLIDLLDDGRPQALDRAEARADVRADGTPPRPPAPEAGLHAGDWGRLVALYARSEMRGFRTMVVPVPPDRAGADTFRVRLRLRGWAWRLIEVELSPRARALAVAALARGGGRVPAASTVGDTAPPER